MIGFEIIKGIKFGLEYLINDLDDPEDYPSTLILLDIAFLRIVFEVY